MCAQTAYPVIDLAETGRRIERQRREAGLTVRDLQAWFGFEYPQAIYKWQHGECLPTVDNLLALARLLRVSMEDLLVYEDQEVTPFLARLTDFSSIIHLRLDLFQPRNTIRFFHLTIHNYSYFACFQAAKYEKSLLSAQDSESWQTLSRIFLTT